MLRGDLRRMAEKKLAEKNWEQSEEEREQFLNEAVEYSMQELAKEDGGLK